MNVNSATLNLNLTQPGGNKAENAIAKLVLGNSDVTIETTLKELADMAVDGQTDLSQLVNDFQDGKISLGTFTKDVQKVMTSMGIATDLIRRFTEMVAASVKRGG